LDSTGAGVESALLQSVIVGFTMLVFTVLAMVIIDRFGRRNLLIAGSLGYIAGPSGAAWAFFAKVEGPLLLVSLLLFIAAHGFGQGASSGCSSARSSRTASARAARPWAATRIGR